VSASPLLASCGLSRAGVAAEVLATQDKATFLQKFHSVYNGLMAQHLLWQRPYIFVNTRQKTIYIEASLLHMVFALQPNHY
jgi:hypothetical protein